jgi:uncharacterized protein YecE (DUF72 family)
MNVRIGPAGWDYKDWYGNVYPHPRPRGFSPARCLADYFDTIEVNSTFYGPPSTKTVLRWVDEVSHNPRFLYTAKLWREFTHSEDLTDANERLFRPGMEAFRDSGRLGALLAQFPWSFKNEPESRAYLEHLCQRLSDFPLVVEVRHVSWNDPGFFNWLAELNVGITNIDQPLIGRSLRPAEQTTSRIGYVRLHGRNYKEWFREHDDEERHQRYNYLYSLEELRPWAERVRSVSEKADVTYVVANNHYLGKAVVNALQMQFLITKKPVRVPPQLLQRYPEQLRELQVK